MKAFILILFSIFNLFDLSAQKNDNVPNPNQDLKVDTIDFETMSFDELYSFMKPYPEAFTHIQFAKESHAFSTVFSTLSGFPLGFALGYFFFTGDFLWQPVAIGGGLLGIALLFESRTKSQTRKAIDAYHARNDSAYSSRLTFSLGVGFTQQGIGFVLSF